VQVLLRSDSGSEPASANAPSVEGKSSMLQSDWETCVWPDLIDCMDIPNPNTVIT
jgi:hypothetical protein